MKIRTFQKIKIFRIVYLVASILLAAFSAAILAKCIVDGFQTLDFDLVVNMFATTVAMLFEIAIIFFAARSLRTHTTILMKSLVFKQDGKPYLFGVVASFAGSIIFAAISVLLLIAPQLGWLASMKTTMRLFVADVTLILAKNLCFTQLYFWIFRREAGTLSLI